MKALKIVVAAIVVLVVVVVGVLLTVDVSQYKGVIQDQAKAATGRDVKIGDIKLSISLTPAIVVSDVSFANAPWGSKPTMLTAKRIEAGTQLIPLLTGSIKISDVKVVDAEVLLEVNRDGKPNWVFDTPPSSGAGPALSVSGVNAENLKLGYRDAKLGQTADIALGSAIIKIAGDVANLEITDVDLTSAKINFKDKAQSADIQLGKLSLDSKGPITALGITALDVGDAKLAYKGDGAPIDAAFSTLKIGGDGAVSIDGTLSGQAVKANGTLAPIGDLISLKKSFPAKLSIDAMGIKATTDLLVDVSKKIPSLNGSLSVPELNLASATPAAAPPPSAKPAKGAPAAKIFPDDPLPWNMLSSAEADVKLTVGKLTLPNGLSVSDITVPVSLKGGKLIANGLAASLAASLAGGKVAADLGLSQADKSLSLKATAQGFTAENFAKEFKVTDMITQGAVDLTVDVRGNGNSVRALMAGLNGSVIGGMGESRIRNDALNIIGADVIMQVISAINPVGNKDPYTVAKCAVVNFQITNGIANTDKGIAMVSDKMEVVSTGKIDLAQEQLDLAIRPKATSGISIGMGNLTQAVKLAGPLSKPGVTVDAKGAVKALGTLGAAFATGGASLLVQSAAEKLDGTSDPCAAARVWHTAKK
ncbi:MAG: AsmA family protein [Rhodospirillaceae bacterium]|nr:AsmA family protein [Rhodospirillaceae bacterium]